MIPLSQLGVSPASEVNGSQGKDDAQVDRQSVDGQTTTLRGNHRGRGAKTVTEGVEERRRSITSSVIQWQQCDDPFMEDRPNIENIK